MDASIGPVTDRGGQAAMPARAPRCTWGSADGRQPPRTERGMVTVEVAFAVMLSAVVALGLCYVIALVVQLGELQAVAGEVARQQARSDTAAAQRAADDAPSGTVVRVSRNGSDVVVVAELRSQPWGGWIPAMALAARAVVSKEGV